ncbi:MAG TPA: hypothetical protein VGT04_09610, partial [Acidobacteriaceae bacterium]|nr:hypothetical protein [Acidobacteriaceae bacterium]
AYYVTWTTVGFQGETSKGGEGASNIDIPPHSFRLISLVGAFGNATAGGDQATELKEAARLMLCSNRSEA